MPCTMEELLAAQDLINSERALLQNRGLSTHFLEAHIMSRLGDLDPRFRAVAEDNDSSISDTDSTGVSQEDSEDVEETGKHKGGENVKKRKRDASDEGAGDHKLPEPKKLIRSARKRPTRSGGILATSSKPKGAQDTGPPASEPPTKTVVDGEGEATPVRFSLRIRNKLEK